MNRVIQHRALKFREPSGHTSTPDVVVKASRDLRHERGLGRALSDKEMDPSVYTDLVEQKAEEMGRPQRGLWSRRGRRYQPLGSVDVHLGADLDAAVPRGSSQASRDRLEALQRMFTEADKQLDDMDLALDVEFSGSTSQLALLSRVCGSPEDAEVFARVIELSRVDPETEKQWLTEFEERKKQEKLKSRRHAAGVRARAGQRGSAGRSRRQRSAGRRGGGGSAAAAGRAAAGRGRMMLTAKERRERLAAQRRSSRRLLQSSGGGDLDTVDRIRMLGNESLLRKKKKKKANKGKLSLKHKKGVTWRPGTQSQTNLRRNHLEETPLQHQMRWRSAFERAREVKDRKLVRRLAREAQYRAQAEADHELVAKVDAIVQQDSVNFAIRPIKFAPHGGVVDMERAHEAVMRGEVDPPNESRAGKRKSIWQRALEKRHEERLEEATRNQAFHKIAGAFMRMRKNKKLDKMLHGKSHVKSAPLLPTKRRSGQGVASFKLPLITPES